jgi:hypothetical protein
MNSRQIGLRQDETDRYREMKNSEHEMRKIERTGRRAYRHAMRNKDYGAAMQAIDWTTKNNGDTGAGIRSAGNTQRMLAQMDQTSTFGRGRYTNEPPPASTAGSSESSSTTVTSEPVAGASPATEASPVSAPAGPLSSVLNYPLTSTLGGMPSAANLLNQSKAIGGRIFNEATLGNLSVKPTLQQVQNSDSILLNRAQDIGGRIFDNGPVLGKLSVGPAAGQSQNTTPSQTATSPIAPVQPAVTSPITPAQAAATTSAQVIPAASQQMSAPMPNGPLVNNAIAPVSAAIRQTPPTPGIFSRGLTGIAEMTGSALDQVKQGAKSAILSDFGANISEAEKYIFGLTGITPSKRVSPMVLEKQQVDELLQRLNSSR